MTEFIIEQLSKINDELKGKVQYLENQIKMMNHFLLIKDEKEIKEEKIIFDGNVIKRIRPSGFVNGLIFDEKGKVVGREKDCEFLYYARDWINITHNKIEPEYVSLAIARYTMPVGRDYWTFAQNPYAGVLLTKENWKKVFDIIMKGASK